MRVFVAGASGVLGVKLVPLLVGAGHEVAGMTRSPEKAEGLRMLGAEPIACDVFDADALCEAVVGFGPEALIDQLTALPDDPGRIAEFDAANARIRREGTRNLLAAAKAAGAARILAQSVAWQLAGDAGAAVEERERAVLDARGVVLRYGRLYGPGTYYEVQKPSPPRIYVAEAARRTLPALGLETGVITIAET
jgi:nucleoside-diphosphate-sugar epimerase